MLRKLVLVVGLCFVLGIAAVHADQELQLLDIEASYPVAKVDIAPSVDGVLDDPAWASVPAMPIRWHLDSHEEWVLDRDFEGIFQAVWRDQTLYVAIRLHDDQIDTASPVIEEKDRIEVYLDLDHVGRRTEEYRYVLPVQEDRTYEYYPEAFVMWGPVEDVCELSFDMQQIPRQNRMIGFAVEYIDIDTGEASSVLSWPSELAVDANELGDLLIEVDGQRDLQQMGVTWGAIKALF